MNETQAKSEIQNNEKDPESLADITLEAGQIKEHSGVVHDAVFGEITEDGPNFRNVSGDFAGL